MFWMVLAVVMLALAVVTRIHPLMISTLGMVIATALAWQGMGVLVQLACVAVAVGASVFLWFQQAKPQPSHQRESASASRLSGLGALSNFSAFSDESDEVTVDEWDSRGQTVVYFRGREWKARVAKGAQARPGLYKVREVREGQLVLDEVID